MNEVNKFYNWFVGLGGDVTQLDVPNVLERLNTADKKVKRNRNLKRFNHVFKDERYY